MSRRTNEQIKADIIEAIGKLLKTKNFTHISLMDISREARTDPNVILRQFGSLEQALDRYVYSIDYWMYDLLGNKDLKKGDEKALEKLFEKLTRFLYASPQMQRLLTWEITDVNTTTMRAATNREIHYREAYDAYSRIFEAEGIPSRHIISLMVAGTYYLVLHRKTSTFGSVDYDSEEGKKTLVETLKTVVSMMFAFLERKRKVQAAAEKLKEKGVAEDIIDECLKELYP